MMKRTDTLPCEVVRDLIPLYLEDLTGEETREMVEQHLTDCPECAEFVDLLKIGEPPVLKEDDQKEIDYLKQIRRKSRRKVFITLFSVFLVLLISVLYLAAGPSETKKMEQALVNACNLEGREFHDAVNEISGPDSASMLPEVREAKINEFYENVDRNFAGQMNAALKDAFRNLADRENSELPMECTIESRMKTDGFSFAYYEGSRNAAHLIARRQVVELGVRHEWLEHDADGGLIGCYRVNFTCSHIKEKTQMVREDGNWKVYQFDYQPIEIEPGEQYAIRLFGEETVNRIRQATQKRFDTFEEARVEAEKLQKLISTNEEY